MIALMIAAENGKKAVVDVLVSKGADVDMRHGWVRVPSDRYTRIITSHVFHITTVVLIVLSILNLVVWWNCLG